MKYWNDSTPVKKSVEQTQTWPELALVWAGSAVAISGFVVGGALATGSSFWEATFMAVIGYAILVGLMILQGMQGSDLGKGAVEIASQAFGKKGSRTITSLILVISCLGWFGIQTNIVGNTFTGFMENYGVAIPVWVSSLIWGAIMLLTAVYGMKGISLLGKIAVPTLAIVTLIVTYNVLQENGWNAVVEYQGTGQSFTFGVSTVVGALATGTVIAPDYFRHTPTRSNVVKSSLAGILPAGILMIAVGALLTIATGSSNISQVFLDYSTPVLGLIAILAATWTTNVTNAYSGGVAFNDLLNISDDKKNIGILIAGSIGIFLAVIGILDYFEIIMNLLTAMIPPIAGVMIASYWITHHGDPLEWSAAEGYDAIGIISWLLGAIFASAPIFLGFFGIAFPSSPLIGMIISFATFVVTAKIKERRVGVEV